MIEKNKMVSVTYELRLSDKNGEVVESTGDEAVTFPFGVDMLLPSFENGIVDKEIGDDFEIEIPAKDAYGEVDEYAVVNIPKTAFMVNGKIDDEMVAVGNALPMMSDDGSAMTGVIVSVEENEVIMDFNHPLAGQDLYFKGKIVDIRDATEEELSHQCDNEECGDDCECHNEE